MSPEVTLRMRANTRLCAACLRVVAMVVPLIGRERAWRLGVWLAERTIFVKIGNERWRQLRVRYDGEWDA